MKGLVLINSANVSMLIVNKEVDKEYRWCREKNRPFINLFEEFIIKLLEEHPVDPIKCLLSLSQARKH